MNPDNRRPILYKGELYSKSIIKGGGGPGKVPKTSYEDARIKIISDIKKTRDAIDQTSSGFKLPNEFVISLRIDPDFSAKSYYPATLFDANMIDIEEIGSRIWRDEDDQEFGKMFFVRTTANGLKKLEEKLNTEESGVKKAFALDVRKLKSLDFLQPDEQILGIPSGWKEGRLEAVLHPFDKDNAIVLDHFISLLKDTGIDMSKIHSKQYETGVTFVSLFGNKKVLEKLSSYNPLRTIHPLSLKEIDFRVARIKSSAPLPPMDKERSKIVMGVFDGGLQEGNPYIDPYTERVDLTKSKPDDGLVAHGTLVTSAALYGPVNNLGPKDILQKPNISVRNFRVFSTLDADPDLYEVIDMMERIIPEQKDIQVYNISFGPVGPILDDHISRFTFACDLLGAKHNVLFCTAVGNDGEAEPEYLRRIQSPSDMVNGLAVGAYSKRDGKIIKAPYSSIGPGREGNKLKPDISAFGGCDQTPIHLISTEIGSKDSTCGTSFSSPIVASWATQLIGYSSGAISPLVSRAMLIHSALSAGDSGHNNEFGHGILPNSIEDIITCKSNSFTLIYQGELEFGKYAEFKIPWINEIKKGKVKFNWTSVVLSGIDPQGPDDYTTGSTMVSFYPHSNKYVFSKGSKTRRVDLNTESHIAEELEKDGWEKHTFPISESGSVDYATEEELRVDMKWDTVDCRDSGKLTESIFEPMFHIHALSRGHRYISRKIRFALVVSVELADTEIDLYSEIINKYDLLVPIKLNIQTNIQIKNN